MVNLVDIYIINTALSLFFVIEKSFVNFFFGEK